MLGVHTYTVMKLWFVSWFESVIGGERLMKYVFLADVSHLLCVYCESVCLSVVYCVCILLLWCRYDCFKYMLGLRVVSMAF